MNNGTAANSKRLLWAGFFAIFASGVGFSVRGGILVDWAKDYGFTQLELGGISGGGLWGFGLIILAGAFLAEWIGYGRLMALAVLMHLLSAGLQLCTGEIYERFGKDATMYSLTIAMFLFAVGNGICEAVVNPMVAALFPDRKTHYLNILHAGWPGGLIAGGVLSYLMNGGSIGEWVPIGKVHWLIQMSMFLIPVAIYGLMLAGQKFPKSEAGEAGVSFGTMLLEFLSPILLLLLLIHALVGYVELGTDSWIPKITGGIFNNPAWGMLLFIYTSGLMFALRFFAGPIEHKLTPLGLLCISGILGCCGLTLLGNATGVFMCVVAATIYALGKTFLWPTMLAIVSERFPKGGSLTIGAVGGVGMLSAGLLGAPGIGFKQDYYATTELKSKSEETYERYSAKEEKTFLVEFKVRGLDGTKQAILDLDETEKALEKDAAKAPNEKVKKELEQKAKDTQGELERTLKNQPPTKGNEQSLTEWWAASKPFADKDGPLVKEANLFGGQMALKLTAIVPATMAVLYLLLIGYFKMRGGYTKVQIDETAEKAKEMMNIMEA
jgi:MFS family permease